MKLRPFELVLIGVFGSLFVIALILLSTYSPSDENDPAKVTGTVVIWGVLPSPAFSDLIREIEGTDKSFQNVSYRYVDPVSFDNEFVNALADQKPPDLILIGHDRIVEHRKRLQAITYDAYPIRDFRSTYTDGAEIFALSDGIYALPIAVNPLVLFWNRDIFANKNLSAAPRTWEELVGEVVPALTLRDSNRNITRPAIAFGEYGNVKNAFPILSLLLIQGGSALVTESQSFYKVRLEEVIGQAPARPLTGAVSFFTNFNNTGNTLYSWNRSFRQDREMFLSEDLAMYFGFASEGKEIQAKNPNLSFDIAPVPQGAAATVKRNYGLYYGLAIPKAAKNKLGASIILQQLSSQTNAQKLTTAYNLAPVFRSSVTAGSNDVYGRIAYESALYTRGWLSPDQDQLDVILRQMLDSVTANRSNLGSAVSDALVKIEQIY